MSITVTRPAPIAPDRSYHQRMLALDRANFVRSARADLKRDLKAGRKRAVDVLLNPPWWAETMKVIELLLATPKIGRVKATRALMVSSVSASKTLGGISARQRSDLHARLAAIEARR